MTMAAAGTPKRLDIGRVGRETFDLIRRDPAGTYGLALAILLVPALLPLIFVPLGLTAAATSVPIGGRTAFFQAMGAGGVVIFVVALAAAVLMYGALSFGAVERLQGRRPSIGAQLSAAGAVLLPMIGIAILGYIALILGFLLFIVPGLFLATLWVVVIVPAVVERTGVFASFSRSAELTRNNRWRVFLLLVIYILGAMVFGLFSVLLQGATGVLRAGGGVTLGVGLVVSTLVGLLINAVLTTVGAVGVGVLYQELRRARGEFDAARLAEVFS